MNSNKSVTNYGVTLQNLSIDALNNIVEEESDRSLKLHDVSISNTFLESVRMFEIMSAITGRGSSTSPATPSTSSVLEHWVVT